MPEEACSSLPGTFIFFVPGRGLWALSGLSGLSCLSGISGISAAKQKQFSKSCPTGTSFGRACFYLMQNGGERSTRLIVRKSFARRSAWCAICSCRFAKNYIFYGNLNGCLEIIDTFANQSNKNVVICKYGGDALPFAAGYGITFKIDSI